MSKQKTTKQRPINGKQARFLRGLGHHLSPSTMIGKDGITDTVITTITDNLRVHELVKIKLQNTCPLDRHDAASSIAEKTGAVTAQVLGKTILLFKENKKLKADKRITLP